jgi:hypothetical protein
VKYLVLTPMATTAAVLALAGAACVTVANELVRFIEYRI